MDRSTELKTKLKSVYKDGFNIYAALNKVKRKIKVPADMRGTTEHDFPDEVLIGVCDSYWRSKPGIKDRWPWFLSAMEYQTRLWISDQREQENAKHKRAPASQALKDIMKGMFQ